MTDSISEELYQGSVIPDGDRTMNTAALKHELQHSMTTMKDDLMKQYEEYFIGLEGDEDNSDPDDDQNTKELQVPTSLENYLADGSGVSPKTKQSAFAELEAEFSTAEKTGPLVDDKLAAVIDDLVKGKLPKSKVEELVDKYPRPQNCETLVSSKVKKVV